MAETRVRVDPFCEDGAHEDCGRAIIGRCARDSAVAVTTTARSARAGLPRVKSELRVFQRTVSQGGGVVPDLLVVLADEPDVRAAGGRDAWKTGLQRALTEADEVVIHGGAEFAPEIFEAMDFYRAGRQAPELQAFTDELRGAFRLMAQARKH